MNKVAIKDEYTLNVRNEADPQNPREYNDNFGTIIGLKGSAYKLADEEFESWEMITRYMTGITEQGGAVLPVYLYDHGGQYLSISRPITAHGNWDVSQIGYVYATKETLEAEGYRGVEAKDSAISLMQKEIDIYKKYLNGEVYVCDLYEGDELRVSMDDFYSLEDIKDSLPFMIEANIFDPSGNVKEIASGLFDRLSERSGEFSIERFMYDRVRARNIKLENEIKKLKSTAKDGVLQDFNNDDLISEIVTEVVNEGLGNYGIDSRECFLVLVDDCIKDEIQKYDDLIDRQPVEDLRIAVIEDALEEIEIRERAGMCVVTDFPKDIANEVLTDLKAEREAQATQNQTLDAKANEAKVAAQVIGHSTTPSPSKNVQR